MGSRGCSFNGVGAAQGSTPRSNSVKHLSLAIEFYRVAEMVLFQDLDVVVLEEAPERNDP